MVSRARAFVFTFNNYTPADEDRLRLIDCKYLIYGRERAPTTGTQHLQGYIRYANPRSVVSVRRVLGCHVEVARGLPSQCIQYCKKDGDVHEQGEVPADPAESGEGELERWKQAWQSAKEGKIEEVPADIRVRCYCTLKRIHRDFQQAVGLLASPCGVWIHGEAGSGKTMSVFTLYPSLYTKGASKWWDGYDQHDVVLLDDIDPEQRAWIGRFLKIWADRYPFVAESKGQSLQIRPKKFVVTSQYTIEEIFHDEQTRSALNRRFTVIKKNKDQEILF